MDPNYAQFLATLGALSKLVVLSIILERGLAFLFEHDWFRAVFTREVTDPSDATKKVRESKIPGLQGCLALAAALAICHYYQFDVMAALFAMAAPDRVGMTITGIIAAGGSAGAIAIFQGFLNFNRDSREALIAARKSEAEALAAIAKAQAEQRKYEAEAKKAQAEADQADAEARKARAETVQITEAGDKIHAQIRLHALEVQAQQARASGGS